MERLTLFLPVDDENHKAKHDWRKSEQMIFYEQATLNSHVMVKS